MTKDDIVNDIMTKVSAGQLNKKEAKDIVELIIQAIKHSVKNQQKLLITNFGVFSCKRRSKRIGRNPLSLKEHEISERFAVSFSPARNFRKSMPKPDET